MPIYFTKHNLTNYRQEFPTRKISNRETCSICKETFRTMKGHQEIFTHEGIGSGRHPHHVECLSLWLERNETCPCCREENKVPRAKWHQIKLNDFTPFTIIGALGLLNKFGFDYAGPLAKRVIFAGNNIVFTSGLTAGIAQSIFSIDGFPTSFRTIISAVFPIITLLDTETIELATAAAAAAIFATIAARRAVQAGVCSKKLVQVMLVSSVLSSVTSMLKLPLPIIPIALFSSCMNLDKWMEITD